MNFRGEFKDFVQAVSCTNKNITFLKKVKNDMI